MCGIAGVVSGNRDQAARALSEMVRVQWHRGPDDGGESWIELSDRVLGLGHRRLAILDLSPAGHQPMVHPQTGDQLVFNGEIYNFQALRRELEAEGVAFRGHSDTEVVLHGLSRWGAAFIERLEGMFALAFYEAGARRLLLARDCLGIKPLYVARSGGSLLFASEVRALLASGMIPRMLDWRGLSAYLAYGSVPEPCTLFRGVEMFPAGCWQWFDLSRAELPSEPVQKYWTFPPVRAELTEPEVIERLRQTFDVAARDHLVSDVPVGVFLSSGIDSTILATLAARHSRKLPMFTVGFADQPDMSETPLAAETARRIGCEHHDIQITGQTALDSVERWLMSLDQPSTDGLNTYVISEAIRSQGIVVAMSGLGGDELFCGYRSFRVVPPVHRWMKALSWVPVFARVAAARAATVGRATAVKRKAVEMAGSRGGVLELYLQCRRVASTEHLEQLGVRPDACGVTPDYLPTVALDGLSWNGPHTIWELSRLESRLYMGNTLLRDTDTNGMAHSLEIRPALLDRRILDFAFTIPDHLRAPRDKPDKHLLRKAFPEALRPELLQQKKRGFTLPIARWIAGPLRAMCLDGLAHLKSMDILRPAGVDRVWNQFINSADRFRYSGVLSLCVLGLYARRLGL